MSAAGACLKFPVSWMLTLVGGTLPSSRASACCSSSCAFTFCWIWASCACSSWMPCSPWRMMRGPFWVWISCAVTVTVIMLGAAGSGITGAGGGAGGASGPDKNLVVLAGEGSSYECNIGK